MVEDLHQIGWLLLPLTFSSPRCWLFQVRVVDLRVCVFRHEYGDTIMFNLNKMFLILFRAAEERAGLRVASVKVANVSQTTVSIRTLETTQTLPIQWPSTSLDATYQYHVYMCRIYQHIQWFQDTISSKVRVLRGRLSGKCCWDSGKWCVEERCCHQNCGDYWSDTKCNVQLLRHFDARWTE